MTGALSNKVMSESIFGNYRVVSQLESNSGRAALYAGEHLHLGTRAAIKVLYGAFTVDRDRLERWLSDNRNATATGHPGIARMLEGSSGTPEAHPADAYVATELFDGEDLSKLVGRGPLRAAVAIDIARQTAAALGAAHAARIVHGEMSPSNLFLVPSDTTASGVHVKVLDFGLGHLEPHDRRLGVEHRGPEYIAPEQCMGQSVDHRADLYALGCMLFHMLCGRPPFSAESFMRTLIQHVTAPAPDPRSIDATIPMPLATLVGRLLAKEPAVRLPSMDAVIASLDRAGGA